MINRDTSMGNEFSLHKPAMASQFINFRHSAIHYRTFGNGPILTICFHGFAEDATSFEKLAESMQEHRLVAIDLPFHGKTAWNEGLHLTIPDLIEIIRLCPEIGDEPFGIMGYSMGGKVALSVLEALNGKITHLFLIAPDGLRADPWHWFGTKTLIGGHILRYTMQQPAWFLSLLKIMRRTGLVNESIYKFVLYYVDEPYMRNKVYMIWTTMRDFRPNITAIIGSIKKERIPVKMVFGKFDRLCPYKWGQQFARSLDGLAELKILDTGHLLLHEKHVPKVAAVFCHTFAQTNLRTS